MKVGPRIKSLLDWAQNHSPRTKELRRYVDDLHAAVLQDIERTKEVIRIAGQLQKDRDQMAGIAFKLARELTVTGIVHFSGEEMTSDEYRLYTAARINLIALPYIGKPLEDETRQALLGAVEIAFEEVKSLGCTEDLIADMRNNFHRSLQLQPPEDQALTTAEDVAILSSGG